jgi:hypothetical protein
VNRCLALAAALLVPAAAHADDAPTWYRDVQPIFQEHCEVCHREGDIGPFALDDGEDAAGWAPMIEEVVTDRRMPPWFADPEVGHFKNARGLSEAERATILAWARGGAPAGDPAHAPAPKEWPVGWRIGEPDVVVSMPEPYEVPATGVVDYQYYDVPTDFGEEKWVTAAEFRMGAPEVVHHVLVFVKYPDGSERQVRGGLEGYFFGGLPGETTMILPPGMGKRLPKGATLRFQLHYTPNGEAQSDRTELALVFAKPGETITREVETHALFNSRFEIPPRVKGHTIRARYRFDQDRIVFGLRPHMHLRGESFRYLLLYPNGENRELLRIPRYDFNWQFDYLFEEPLLVPAGSTMLGVATYDNSADNPANPDPGKAVAFGEQTFDEMMIGYIHNYLATAEERAAWDVANPGKGERKRAGRRRGERRR